MSPYFLYFFSLFLLLFFHIPTCNAENPLRVECNNTYNGKTAANYTINSTFHTNLKILLPSLSSNVSLTKGFYNTSIGQGLDTVYGLVLCRGDATPEACRNCTNCASDGILSRCQSRSSVIWNDLCQLQYSDTNFFNLSTTIWWFWEWSMNNVTDSVKELFKDFRGTLMREIAYKAAYQPSLGMFATGASRYSSTNNVYGLVQCKPVISGVACHRCLQDAIGFIPTCCDSRIGGRVIGEVCSLRFEDWKFFEDLLVEELATAPELPPSFTDPTNSGRGRSNGPQVKIIIIGTVSGAIVLILACIVFVFFIRKSVKRTNDSENNATAFSLWQRPVKNVEAFLQNCGSLAPKWYRYSKLKKITNSFKDKLGEGGYGGVFKGKLKDGRLIAVKVLNSSKGNGEEFINEVASIGRTNHVNIVTLLGFCYEGSKRALIYEFMSNGSLEKFIYSNKSEGAQRALTCERLFQIAVGIARGLEYLHRGCSTRILHFDIKPHNILLDDEYCPKISDFGLAKLCPEHESIISMQDPRGTMGYIAPEVYCRNIGGVSYKSDVYSYGMMVLEMVGGRKNIDAQAENTSEIYFPHWVYNHIASEDCFKLIGILEEEEREIARKMVLVGLWCIQTNPTNRPSMSRVVEMLEGSVQGLEMPPKPYLSSP